MILKILIFHLDIPKNYNQNVSVSKRNSTLTLQILQYNKQPILIVILVVKGFIAIVNNGIPIRISEKINYVLT